MMNDDEPTPQSTRNKQTLQLQVSWACPGDTREDSMAIWTRGNEIMEQIETEFKLEGQGAGTGFGRRDIDYYLPEDMTALEFFNLTERLAPLELELPDFEYSTFPADTDDDDD